MGAIQIFNWHFAWVADNIAEKPRTLLFDLTQVWPHGLLFLAGARYLHRTFLEVSPMCDYSLAQFPNRLAVKGEQLVIHQFASQTMGLAPIRRSLKQILFPPAVPAICVPPGARLFLRDIPEHLQRLLNVDNVEEVTSVQKSAESFIYRDAVRFANGQEVLIQCLRRGQRVDVLSLCGIEVDEEIKADEAAFTAPFQ
jgi:hypothetical protein